MRIKATHKMLMKLTPGVATLVVQGEVVHTLYYSDRHECRLHKWDGEILETQIEIYQIHPYGFTVLPKKTKSF